MTMRLIDADADALIARINNSFGSVTRFIIKSILKDAPTIEAEPVRHSRWVKDSDGDEYCENCSRYMPVREVTGDPSANDYCPNCGAKMDGDSHD
jgi:hypothetical protein